MSCRFTLREGQGYVASVSNAVGASWALEVSYACLCGVHYRARCWRWLDREALADETERTRREGPLRGRCPSCGAPATGQTDWVEFEPSRDRVTLILGPHQRHQLTEKLRDYLDEVAERVRSGDLERAVPWQLRPLWRFAGEGTVTGVHPVPAMEAQEDTARRHAPPSRPRQTSPTAGIPKLVGQAWPQDRDSSQTADTYVAMLVMDQGATDDEEVVTMSLDFDAASRSMWGQAALQVRPIHLRGHNYPLIGVRLVASYLGRMALIDGLVDVGSEDASRIFASLSRRFRVQLILGGAGDSNTSVIRREVSARNLERNAALAFESGRAALARSEYPREAFVRGLESLRVTPLEDRLRSAEQTLVTGSYRHLISPRETWVALEHLEAASDKRNLAHLLEVDGLSVDEYEAVRRRVLVASVEHGLCAPRRFWRRIVASGLADDFGDYATRLSGARAEAAQDGDDLEPEQREEAWTRIAELCDRKELDYPVELSRKLGTESEQPRRRRRRERDENRNRTAAGEINARDTAVGAVVSLRDQLRDPTMRLRVATAALSNGGSSEALSAVLDALDDFDEEELLAIMPSLAELGTQAVSGLHAQLDSPRQQVRQGAAILLGIAGDSSSIVPLLRRLAREETRVWFDVARSIGALGSSALERLCALIRQSARGEQFPVEHSELLARVGRAMAEVVITQGLDSIARDTVEVLAQSSETDISVAAGRALATLHDVSVAGAQVRGERSLPQHTQLRGFARRAYEAILVPELDILDEEVEAEIL